MREHDLEAATITLRWNKTKANQEQLIASTLNVRTLLLPDRQLTDEIIAKRQQSIMDVERRVYNFIRFTGTGHATPFLRNLVFCANKSSTPIESSLPDDSPLGRYINWFPVARAEADY